MNALAEYACVLRTRWRWVLWGVLLALMATTAFLVLQPPLYRSTATVFVRTPGDVSRVVDGGDSYAQARARTYAALATGTDVSSRVIADLGLALRPETLSERIRASNPKGTALITVSASAPSAGEAQRTARVFLMEYAATVRALETVPGSLVPRAELVVVNPPGPPTRVAAWGVPIPLLLFGAALIGLFLGSLGAVLRSLLEGARQTSPSPAHVDATDADTVDEPMPAGEDAPAEIAPAAATADEDQTLTASTTSDADAHHRHRRRLRGAVAHARTGARATGATALDLSEPETTESRK